MVEEQQNNINKLFHYKQLEQGAAIQALDIKNKNLAKENIL